MLLRKGLSHEHDLDALKLIVVVAHDDLDAIRTAHAGADLLEDGERSVFDRDTGAGLQVYVIDGLTLNNVGDVVILAYKSSIHRSLDAQLLFQGFGVARQVCVGLSNFVDVHLLFLDHVEVVLVGEDSIYLTVQFLEGFLDSFSLQLISSYILTQVMVASEGVDISCIIRCDSIKVNSATALSVCMVGTFSKLRAPHKIVTGILWIFLIYIASLGVKFGEVVSVEAIIVVHKSKGRGTVRHAFKLLLIHCLGPHIEMVDVIILKEDDRVFITLRLGALHSSVQVVGDPREHLRDVLGVASFQLVLKVAKHFGVQKQEYMIMVVFAALVVHAECSVHMPQVMMFVQLGERFVGQLRFTMEALEQMVTFEEVWDALLVHSYSIHLHALTAVKDSTSMIRVMTFLRFISLGVTFMM